MAQPSIPPSPSCLHFFLISKQQKFIDISKKGALLIHIQGLHSKANKNKKGVEKPTTPPNKETLKNIHKDSYKRLIPIINCPDPKYRRINERKFQSARGEWHIIEHNPISFLPHCPQKT